MGTSAIPNAIGWLVDTCSAADTLGLADPAVLVVDGPEVYDDSAPLVLWIGVDNPDVNVSDGSSETQTWAGLGALRKNEQLSIPCAARAWNGTNDIRSARAAVFGILAAVENIVRSSANLGGTVLVTLPGVTNVRLRQASTPKGVLADVLFSIDAKARI